MILELKVLEILQDAGFTSAFTDYAGRAQDAPVEQLFTLDEKDVSASDRIIFVRSSGGSFGSVYVQRPSCSIYFVGKQDKSDAATVVEYGDRILTYFLETRQNCGIINIIPNVGVSPVMFTESGRPIVEIPCTILIDREAT